MDMEKIGQFLAALRKSRGLTQMEVADRLGITDKTVSKWECGNGLPDITAIPAIAELFEVTADEILRGERIREEEETEKKQKKTKEQAEYFLTNACYRIRRRLMLDSLGIAFVLLVTLYFMGKNTEQPVLYIVLLFGSAYGLLGYWSVTSYAVKEVMQSALLQQHQTDLRQVKTLTYLCRAALFFRLYVSFLCLSLFLSAVGFGGIWPDITWGHAVYHGISVAAAALGVIGYILFDRVKTQ